MSNNLAVGLSVVFVVSFMLASVIPFATASSFFYRTYMEMDMGKAYDVFQTSDGGYAIVGIIESFGNGDRSFWLVKTDSAGNMEWNKTYTLSGVGDWCHSVIQTKDGGYVLAGEKGYTTVLLIKTDSSGNIEWNQTYGYGVANSVIQTSDGGYALGGYNLEQGFPIFCLVKTDEAGIVPEFPLFLVLPLFVIATLVTTAAIRKHLSSKPFLKRGSHSRFTGRGLP
jgi:hypothetical protein